MNGYSLLLSAVRAQTVMELRLAFRRGESVLLTLIVPPVLLAFLGTMGPMTSITERSLDALVPGIVTLAVISSAMVSLGIATAFERYYGVLKRLGSTPLPRAGLIAAKICAVLVLEIVQIAIIAAIAGFLLHWHPPAGWWPAVPVLIVGTFCFASLGLFMAGTLRAETTLALANGLYLLFLLAGGLVLPIDFLPGWLQLVAYGLPAYAMESVLSAALLQGSYGDSLPLFVIWSGVSLAAAVRFFRWE
ncbi:MAG: ABC transporter permease [Chloroflexota bacterium]